MMTDFNRERFFAQSGEDQWLSEKFVELKLPIHGFFVDVGAGDGEFVSNTKWLEQTMRWTGLLIEPDLRHTIRDRPRSQVERVAVGPAGEATMHFTADPFLSGVLRNKSIHHHPSMRVVEMRTVKLEPLSDVLARREIKQVDVISIDVEGTELSAWGTLDLKRWRPKLAIIELKTWGLVDTSEALIGRLNADGYDLAHRTEYNGIFVDGNQD